MSVGTAAPIKIIAENANVRNSEYVANGRPASRPSGHRWLVEKRNMRTFTELNRYAIAKGAVPVLRVWYILRWLDTDGSGVVDRTQFNEALRLLGITKAHLRLAKARQAALYGADVFYTSHTDKIEYRSLEAVAERLQLLPGRSVYVPVDGCRKIATFSATLYAAWHSPEDRMISRARLADLFGVDERTLRRWDKLARVNVGSNVVEVAAADVDLAMQHISEDDRPHKETAPRRGYVFQRDGKTYYRTVNSYRGRFTTGNRGRVHKANRRVDAAASVLFGAGEKRERVYFDALLLKMLEKRESVDVPCVAAHPQARTIKVQYGSARVWQFSATRPGKKSKNAG